MFEYHNNIFCIQPTALVSLGGVSYAAYETLAKRGKVSVVRRGCRGTPALVAYDSLPEAVKLAVRDKVKALKGVDDPRKLVSENPIRRLVEPDGEALRYFSEYRLASGEALIQRNRDRVLEYTASARVLNAVHAMVSGQQAYCKARGGGRVAVSWAAVAEHVNALDRSEIPHALPANPQQLRRRYRQYLREGYGCLVSKKFCNQNSRKVTELVEQMLLSLCCMENKPYAEWVCGYYLRFVSGEVDVVDAKTGELFSRSDFHDEKGKAITISRSTAWNYINNPKNKAVISALRDNNHDYLSLVRPHYVRRNAQHSFSKITLDDRDLPRKMADGSRVKAYYAYDVCSGALVGAAYSRSKNTSLFLECIRDMFRFINAGGWGMPMEVEVEHHIVKEFKDDIAKAGVLFPFVRFCAAGNSQEKHAENFNRIKKYMYEKRRQADVGRWYAKLPANRTGGERVYDEELDKYAIREKAYYTYEELVADDLEANKAYNSGLHRDQERYPGESCMEVLRSSVNPNLAKIDQPQLVRYIGEHTKTSITRNMYARVQHARYMLPTPEVLKKLQPNSYEVDAYYLPEADGSVERVYLWQRDRFLCEAQRLVGYSTAQAERTEADAAAMTAQAKYVSGWDRMVREAKAGLPSVKVLEGKDFSELQPEVVAVTPDAVDFDDIESSIDALASGYSEADARAMALSTL
jgi:hypothetical protein